MHPAGRVPNAAERGTGLRDALHLRTHLPGNGLCLRLQLLRLIPAVLKSGTRSLRGTRIRVFR